MESVLQTFGINWYLVTAQIVNFLIILYLLKRFVYKPIFTMLKKRQEIILQSINDSKKAAETKEEAEADRKQLIKTAKIEARKIIDEAKTEATQTITTAQEKAKKQTALSMKDAQEEIERETRLAEKRIQIKIGTLIEKILHESLQEYLSPSEQKNIIEKTMQNLSKN